VNSRSSDRALLVHATNKTSPISIIFFGPALLLSGIRSAASDSCAIAISKSDIENAYNVPIARVYIKFTFSARVPPPRQAAAVVVARRWWIYHGRVILLNSVRAVVGLDDIRVCTWLQQKLPHMRLLSAGITENRTEEGENGPAENYNLAQVCLPRTPSQSRSRMRMERAAADYASRFKGSLALSKFCRCCCLRCAAQFFCTRRQPSRLMTTSKKTVYFSLKSLAQREMLISSRNVIFSDAAVLSLSLVFSCSPNRRVACSYLARRAEWLT